MDDKYYDLATKPRDLHDPATDFNGNKIDKWVPIRVLGAPLIAFFLAAAGGMIAEPRLGADILDSLTPSFLKSDDTTPKP